MEWHKRRPQAEIDLCRSGITPRGLDDLDLHWNDLELSGSDPYGYPPLTGAISQRFGTGEKHIVSTLGTSQGLFLLSAALLSPGDRVVIESPAYEPVVAVPGAFETDISRFERRYEEEWTVNLDRFESSIPDDTRMIVMTNLHNPTGICISDRNIEQMADIAASKGAWLCIDEVYREFMDELAGTTAYGTADNIVVVSSLGKVYGLGDLRCGWVMAPPDMAERLRLSIDYINVEGVFIGEKVAALAFGQLEILRERERSRVERNTTLMRDFISSESARLSWVEPSAGVVCFPRLETGVTGDDLAEVLLQEFDTAIAPGSFFGAPEHVRIGFGGTNDDLSSGLQRISSALDTF
jgi:aspartate/methionine/tyrosine aminotransferase